MMVIDFIKEVETNFDVGSIRVKDIQVWPFLRNAYSLSFYFKYIYGPKDDTKHSIFNKINNVNNTLYGFWNLVNKYDYFVFSDALEIRKMNGVYINKLADYLITKLGRNKTLLFENPADGTYIKRSFFSTNNIISSKYFDFATQIPFFKEKYKIKNEEILKKICKKYEIEVNYKQLISQFLTHNKNLHKLFKRNKPRLIVMSQYYSIFHQAVIYTSKKMEISTIELQHGVIDKKHSAYNVFVKLDDSYFPDYLFVFGDYVKNVFDKNNYFINKNRVISIGNMYIDYIKNDYRPSIEIEKLFSQLKKKFKKIVAISSQHTIEEKLIKFLKKSASLNENILYIFVPRNVNKDYSHVNFPENIIILKDLNVYQIIKESDFHSTVYSSCSLEAPALGVPNLLINIDKMATKLYSKILQDKNVTKFIETEEEFVNEILNWHTADKKGILSLHNEFYKQDHKENINEILKILIYKE